MTGFVQFLFCIFSFIYRAIVIRYKMENESQRIHGNGMACIKQNSLTLKLQYSNGGITMKVLMINGSPHAAGSTYTALHEMEKVFEQNGIEVEMLHIGNMDIRGCVACGYCYKNGKCASSNFFAVSFTTSSKAHLPFLQQ